MKRLITTLSILINQSLYGQVAIPPPDIYSSFSSSSASYNFRGSKNCGNLTCTNSYLNYYSLPHDLDALFLESLYYQKKGSSIDLVTFSGPVQINPKITVNRLGQNDEAIWGDNLNMTVASELCAESGWWGLQCEKPGIPDFKIPKEYTLAVWFYYNPSNVFRETIFSVYHYDQFGDDPENGLLIALEGDTEGIYLSRKSSNGFYYDEYFSKSVALSSGPGWYFLAFQSTEYSSKVFLGKTKLYEGVLSDGVFSCSTLQVGNQAFPLKDNYYHLGGDIGALDEFLLWTEALTPEQIKQLYLCSRSGSVSTCLAQQVNHTARLTDVHVDVVQELSEYQNQVSVYPNPSSTGNFTIDLTVGENTPLELSVITPQGLTILQKRDNLTKGSYRFNIKDLDVSCACSDLSPGVYLLKVKTNTLNETRKLIIQ